MEITTINKLPVAALNEISDGGASPATHEGNKSEVTHISAVNGETTGAANPAVNHKEIEKTISNINKMIESMDTSLQFYVHKDSGRVAVKVINNKTKEVIREIPAEEILNLDAKLKETSGLIIDKRI